MVRSSMRKKLSRVGQIEVECYFMQCDQRRPLSSGEPWGMIEKKWESWYWCRRIPEGKVLQAVVWWHVGEIKKESEWWEQSELALNLLHCDPQRDINFLFGLVHTHIFVHTYTYWNQNFTKECSSLSCTMHPDIIYSISFYFPENSGHHYLH